jgi:hypothetical protein
MLIATEFLGCSDALPAKKKIARSAPSSRYLHGKVNRAPNFTLRPVATGQFRIVPAQFGTIGMPCD